MRKNIRFIALILLGAIFSTTVSATNLGSEKINTDNGNSISAQDNVVGKKFAVDVLDINGEYAEATIAGTASDYNVVVSRSNIETVSPINGKYSFILNETYAVSIDYEQSGSKHYSYFEFEIDNSGNVAYGNSMNNEAPLESGFSSSNVTRSARTIQESEPNDSYTTANRTYDDYDNYGLVSSYNDKDFWVVSFDYSGTANFWLGNIPANCNYDIAVYDSDLNFIEYSCNAGTSQELITIDVEANTDYYIYLVGYVSYNTSSKYWLRVKLYPDPPTIPSGAIGVHVTDVSGNPISNAVVYVYRQKYTSPMYPQTAVTTDSYGYAIITGLSTNGTYGVNVVANDYASKSISTFISTSTTCNEVTLNNRQTIQLNDPISGYTTANCWVHNSGLSACTDVCDEYNRLCPHTYMNVKKPFNFGWRYDTSSRLEFHQGVDISHNVTTNTTLYNVFKSTSNVVTAELRTDTGNTVQLYNNGLYATYMHLSSIDSSVVEGGTVASGAILGKAGNTGTYSTGTHLHLSLGTSNALWVSKTVPINDIYTWNASQIETFLDPLAYIN